MQTAQTTQPGPSAHAGPAGTTGAQPVAHGNAGTPQANPYSQYQIIRRNGAVVPFEPQKIGLYLDDRDQLAKSRDYYANVLKDLPEDDPARAVFERNLALVSA